MYTNAYCTYCIREVKYKVLAASVKTLLNSANLPGACSNFQIRMAQTLAPKAVCDPEN
jgi:hypothetical protein